MKISKVPLKVQKRRRPPDVLYSFSSPYGVQTAKDQHPLGDAYSNAIFLSGKKLELRTMHYCSGSRTSKKTGRYA